MMKKIMIFIAGIALIASCQKPAGNQCAMTGTLLNTDSVSVLMVYYGQERDTLAVADDGTFIFETESEKPVMVTFRYGRKGMSLYLSPGKSLDLLVDAADWENSTSFSGDLKDENQYLAESSALAKKVSGDFIAKFTAQPEAFRAKADSVYELNLALIEKYEKQGIDKDFAELEELGKLYGKYLDLVNYPVYHQYYAKVDTVILPDNWYDFKSEMDFNNVRLMDVPAAMQLISSEISEGATKQANLKDDDWGTVKWVGAQFDYIDANLTLPEMIEKFKFDILNTKLDEGPAGEATEIINAYMASSLNEENKTTLKEKMDSWKPLEPGNLAPGFTLPDIDGVNHSLSDFAGKYVYIDFWATWCGPCKAEIPYYRQLVKDYEGRNVQFISISVDRDKAAWEKMVNEEQFPWMQLHDSVMMNDDYLVKYIPTFVFVDTEGKIIDPRAPRPSSDALRALLDSQSGL